jgi:AraC-like DNA-binding protein
MSIDVDELAEYYTRTQPSLRDTHLGVVPANAELSDPITSPAGSGLVIPLCGKACYVLNGVSYELEPGMVLHAGAAMNLDKSVIGNESWGCALIHYTIPTRERNSFPLYNSHFCVDTGTNVRLLECARQLHISERNRGNLASLRTRTLFASLLEELVTSAHRQRQTDEGSLMRSAQTFFDTHYAEELSIRQVADLHGMEPKRFGSLFSRYIGIAPIRYLADVRMQHACELLSMGCYKVEQVAKAVGINDSYYFSRLFKAHIGMAPSVFALQAKHAHLRFEQTSS